jgi:hypothetical protein
MPSPSKSFKGIITISLASLQGTSPTMMLEEASKVTSKKCSPSLQGDHIVPIKPCQNHGMNITTSKPIELNMHELKPNATCVVCFQNK